ncbi:MAG: hypothetical protein ABJG41_07910 [Cyclobacteriaceae bacterium]
MTKTFTENDLVKFLYGELTQQESTVLQEALISNPELQNELSKLKEVMTGLDKERYQPSQRSVDKILAFSKGYEVHSA